MSRFPIPQEKIDDLALPCVECERLPKKSRRNSICLTCSAVVCVACQMYHFMERHEP